MQSFHELTSGSSLIRFTLERKNVKHINLRVQPDGEIKVSAHPDVPYRQIEDFVEDKSDWILKQMRYFDTVRPIPMPEKDYMTGESFRYLGKQYRLKVMEVETDEHVKFYRGFICLYVKDREDQARKKELISSWYQNRRQVIFQESLERMWERIKSYGVNYPKLKTRKMKTRWGSCLIKDETIVMNNDLIYAPKACIDYVVLHELIHFIEKEHNNRFYNLMYLLMPDWEERKRYLDEEMVVKI